MLLYDRKPHQESVHTHSQIWSELSYSLNHQHKAHSTQHTAQSTEPRTHHHRLQCRQQQHWQYRNGNIAPNRTIERDTNS